MRSSRNDNDYAYFNGRIVSINRARVSIKTHAFNYGTCAFEGMKAFYLGRHRWNLHRAQDHIDRLLRTAAILHLASSLDAGQILKVIRKLVLKNGWKQDTYVRPMIYCSLTALGLGSESPTGLAIYCHKARRSRLREISASFSRYTRIPGSAVPFDGKITGVYVNSYLAQRDVVSRGGQLAILKDPKGCITEGYGMNLCAIKGKRLITAPVELGVLDGITRKTVFELVSDMGFKIEEREYKSPTLYNADEVFICGTGAGINAIISVEGRKIGSGKCGPITQRIADTYNRIKLAKHPDFVHWQNVVSI